MNLINRIYNKLGYILLDRSNSFFRLIAIFLINKNHMYMDSKYINYFDILRFLKTSEKIVLTGTGVLIIFIKNKIIKLPLGEHSFIALTKEYKNYLLIKKSELNELVNYDLVKHKNYFIMEKLYCCKSFFISYRNIYKELAKFNVDDLEISTILKSEIFNNALVYTFKENTYDFSENDVVCLLKSEKYIKSCAMHGDLTQFNIMQNCYGDIVVIDLDRFTFHGIENVDRIHFCVEFYAKRKKEDFFMIIESILRDKNISNKYFYLLFIYFVYRIGVEYDKNVVLAFSYKDNVSKIIKLFLIKYKESTT